MEINQYVYDLQVQRQYGAVVKFLCKNSCFDDELLQIELEKLRKTEAGIAYVCLSVCEKDCCKSNLPSSLKLTVIIGLTSQKN